jgi:hypothetical protein
MAAASIYARCNKGVIECRLSGRSIPVADELEADAKKRSFEAQMARRAEIEAATGRRLRGTLAEARYATPPSAPVGEPD